MLLMVVLEEESCYELGASAWLLVHYMRIKNLGIDIFLWNPHFLFSNIGKETTEGPLKDREKSGGFSKKGHDCGIKGI